MDIEKLNKTKHNGFGRDFPIKITLKSGDVLFGHIVVTTQNGDDFEINLFKQIENIDNWNSNRIKLVTRKISITKNSIKDISVYMDY